MEKEKSKYLTRDELGRFILCTFADGHDQYCKISSVDWSSIPIHCLSIQELAITATQCNIFTLW